MTANSIKAADLEQYGITNAEEIFYNPSYELLFEHETNPDLKGYEKGIFEGSNRCEAIYSVPRRLAFIR